MTAASAILGGANNPDIPLPPISLSQRRSASLEHSYSLPSYWIGRAWAAFLPRGDLQEKQWTEKGGQGTLPLRIRLARFITFEPWNLKEHTICAVTATSTSNAAASIAVFTAQDLFYDLPPNAATIILSVISIGLF
ncbi:hypothetical protein E4U59_003526 [Claviceps monticola]|nr:hypothetical protein E4U59_003526 [Claviceps monticola]